ncbi:NAD(P)-dependent oxidoreductase [Orrella daihaiensis]|uniref:NAD(P)-dependent oxidoreductase n=1 Tax=Orrella daihaiensis TaxID=2782176 RepID=A0ABY4AMN2_9BURK|nr:NAD(P)-dependent oxidoreductase [Orrella daihaiensis]UOD50332.1 NAD(P)-dependent oxidoreductase [Orrella daihaiensis]
MKQQTTADKPRIGFIGLGKMGWPMASRLAQDGYALTLLDANLELATQLAQEIGANPATNAKMLAQQSEIIITILPNSSIVQSVLDGSEGLLAGLNPGSIIIDMTSGVPSMTQTLAAQVANAGGHLVDAPVSGGVPRAKTGELSIMFGGSEQLLETVRPVLATMGNAIERIGDVGSAHAMKALNNLVSAGGFLIGIEALMIGKRFGLSPDKMVDVLNASTGMNNSTQKKFKQYVLSGKYNSGFGLDLMVKDLGIALGLAHETQTPAAFSALCHEMWSASARMLGAGNDHTAVAKLVQTLANDSIEDR